MVINNQNQPYYNWSGWWFFATPLKHDGVKVSWDYDIPNIWKNKKRSKPRTSIWCNRFNLFQNWHNIQKAVPHRCIGSMLISPFKGDVVCSKKPTHPHCPGLWSLRMNVSLNIRATQMAGCEASPTHNWEPTSHFESRYIRSATAKRMVQHQSVSGSMLFFLLEVIVGWMVWAPPLITCTNKHE